MNKCPHCGYEYETEWKRNGDGKVAKEVTVKGDEPIRQILLSNDVKMLMWRDSIHDEHKNVGIFGCPKCKFVFWDETF